MNIEYIKSNLQNLADYKDVNNMKNYLTQEEVAYIVKRCDDLLNQTFTFNKVLDMERCLIPYTLDKDIEWNTINNDDEEWCFMLNRMDFIGDLIIGYLATNNIEYANKAKYYINDWIEKHKTIKPELSTRTLDTAMRLLSWTFACIVLENEKLLTDYELSNICNSMLNQIQYLKDNYLSRYKTSNWGTIQTTVVVSILPILLEDYKSTSLYKWAYEEMTLQFSIQVYPDGMFWEQSTMYHAEVLNYGMKAMYFYKYFNENIEESWFKNVEALADALFYQLTPNFEIEAFGDTDRICIKDIFHRASVLFDNPIYKYVGDDNYDVESLYMFGCNFAEKYKNIVAQKPIKNVYDGNDAGMFVIKSGWDMQDSFTMFTNGSLGSGHGHSDNLHISIGYKGELMLIDSGRFTYREDHPLRTQLKGCFAHNTVVLNNSPYCLPNSSWGYESFGTVLKNYVNHQNNYHYLEGGMIGNNPLQVWLRKLVVINPNIWLIVDEVKADNYNRATLNYHIDPYKKVTKKDNNIYINGNNGTLKILQDYEPIIKIQPCSLKYNELLDHNVVSYETYFKNNLQFVTCICDENIQVENIPLYQSDKETLKEVGQAKKFKISDTESYTIAIYHKEIYEGSKILFCEGVAFHGKCIIIYEKNGQKTYKLMKA